MTQDARLLHITDTHLKPAGTPFDRDDHKVDVQIERETRERALDEAFRRLSEKLQKAQQKLDGVIFCGDAWNAGVSGGDKLLLNSMTKHLTVLGITPERIVAVPGNHDVPKGAAPSSRERYDKFIDTWRAAGCITPWLDGIDPPDADPARHVLMGPGNAWAVVAVNSSNWSHVDAVPKELKTIWDTIPATLSPSDMSRKDEIAKALTKLAQYDMARVSPQQLEALRKILGKLPLCDQGRQLRLLALHHHLRSPTLVEELKPFSDVSNIEQLRTFIAQQDFRVVLHGHKHASRVQADFVELAEDHAPHKVLVVAGASFTPSAHEDAMRILRLEGLPLAPSLEVMPQVIPRDGIESIQPATIRRRIWSPIENSTKAPVVIQGSDFDEVYAKAVLAAQEEAREQTLIVQLDLVDFAAVKRLPSTYPVIPGNGVDREEWLKGLVDCWQLPQSQLHVRVPYLHGTRLHRYGNNLNQVKRVRELLTDGQTTRAIALLVDPAIDFKDEVDTKVDFASFCLVQFSRRADGAGNDFIDCVGYYRAQEMVKWWPINVAELHHLQIEVGESFGAKPGRITTVTACARAQARSPTHVAMPAIDRWLDQSPEKYFVLASSLLNQGPLDTNASRVFNEWLAALNDLVETATTPTPDGGPVVAIEGPRRLAAYLLSGGGGPHAERYVKLASDLKEIARLGSDPPPSNERTKRQQWGAQLAQLLRSVSNECQSLRG